MLLCFSCNQEFNRKIKEDVGKVLVFFAPTLRNPACSRQVCGIIIKAITQRMSYHRHINRQTGLLKVKIKNKIQLFYFLNNSFSLERQYLTIEANQIIYLIFLSDRYFLTLKLRTMNWFTESFYYFYRFFYRTWLI